LLFSKKKVAEVKDPINEIFPSFTDLPNGLEKVDPLTFIAYRRHHDPQGKNI